MKYFSYWFCDLALYVLTLNFFARKRIIREFTKNKKFKNILDAGCGTGTLCSLFSPKEYYGIDIDKNAVIYARNKYPTYNFTAGNLTKLNIKRKLDLVLVIGVLHHLSSKDIDKFFNSLNSFLIKDARIIVIDATAPFLKFNMLGYLLRQFDKGKFIRNSQEYKKLISKKFKIIKEDRATELFFDYAVFLASPKMV